MAAGSDDGGVPFEEWKGARDLISNFDQRIHDLRQWGFSFITALLAAQSLLLPSLLPGAAGSGSSSSSSTIAEPVKFSVLAVTLILIVALRQVEKNYQVYQKAANFRSLVLERQLNVELGTTITDRYERFHMSHKITAIYILFAAADAVLGAFVLSDWIYSPLLVAASVLGALWVFQIGRSDVYFARGERSDWTFDRLACAPGQTLTITLTNMSEADPIGLEGGDAIIAIRRSLPAQVSAGGVHTSATPEFEFVKTRVKVRVEALRYYSWTWTTKSDMEIGIYEVFPTVARSWIEKLGEKDLAPLREAASAVGLWTPEQVISEEKKRGTRFLRWVWPKPLARSLLITKSPRAKAD